MKDKDELCNYCLQVAHYWNNTPQLRFGQLLNSVFDIIKQDGYDPFYISDEQLVEYIKEYVEQFK